MDYSSERVVRLFGQSMTESNGDADDYAFYDSDSEEGDGADVADDLASFDAAGMGEYTPEVLTNGYASEQPDFPEESMEGFNTDGRGFYPSMLVRAAFAPSLSAVCWPLSSGSGGKMCSR